MKVYDCFPFYNELELLELRLKSYYDLVDYFVIVESDKTQNNEPKPFYFEENKDKFAEFMPKIRNVKISLNIAYKGVGDWSLEFAQRNAISYGLSDAEPEDFVFISDLDEFYLQDILQRITNRQVTLMSNYIPHLSKKRLVVPCQIMADAVDLLEYCPIAIKQEQHYYYMDLVDPHLHWPGTIIVKFKNLTTPQELRNYRYGLPYILNGGWHFGWQGGVDRIIKKIYSNVEGPEAVKKGILVTEKKDVEALMKAGVFTDKKLNYVDIQHVNLPYISEFIKKYPHFLKPKD